MNPNVDLSSVTRVFSRLVAELREKRLWPVAIVLVVATVAVPVALSKSSSPGPVAQAPVGAPPAAGTSLPTISEHSTPSRSHLTGTARNPFAQQAVRQAPTTSSATTPGASTSAARSAGATSGGASVPTTGSGAGGSSGSYIPPVSHPTAPPSITHGATPTPAPSGLRPTQSYDVALAITNSSGGLNTTDPLERLSVLPSDQSPMMIELGVQTGGNRVLFVVQPGTIVNGPGVCTPGPIDCEVLSLAPGQTEGMSRQTAAGVIAGPLFAVTGITATDNGSAQAAAAARRQESAAGRALVSKSPLTALSLFQYQPTLGAVVDLRDLGVGGS